MNKTELIDKISSSRGIDRGTAEKTINAALEIIMREVARGYAVQLSGFCTFSLAEVGERKGNNPRTGEEITIPAHKRPAFRAGKSFRNIVNL